MMNNHFNVPPPPNPQRALSIGSSQMIPTAVTALLTAHQRKPRSESTNSPPASANVPIAGCSDGTPRSAGKGNPFQFHVVASMPTLLQDRNRPLVPFYATPPRVGSQFSLRRQHSSGAAVYSTGAVKSGTKATGRYLTPPPRVVHKGSDEEEVPAVFAGSKFSDSPSAKNLPLPPPQWLDEIEKRIAEKQTKVKDTANNTKKKTAGMDGIEEEETTSDDTGVVFDLEDVSPTSSFDNETPATGPSSAPDSASAGVRVDPMKLIAALAVKP